MTHPHLEGLIRKWRFDVDLLNAGGSVIGGVQAAMLSSAIAELEAALAALPGGGVAGWRAIETAPKDGTVVLVTVAAKDAEIEKGYFNRGAWYVVNNGDYYDGGHGNDYRTTSVPGNGNYGLPTHWMPLPSPPSPHEADRNDR